MRKQRTQKNKIMDNRFKNIGLENNRAHISVCLNVSTVFIVERKKAPRLLLRQKMAINCDISMDKQSHTLFWVGCNYSIHALNPMSVTLTISITQSPFHPHTLHPHTPHTHTPNTHTHTPTCESIAIYGFGNGPKVGWVKTLPWCIAHKGSA